MRLLRRSSNEFPVIAAADLAVATEDFEANGQIRLNAAQFRLRPELCFFGGCRDLRPCSSNATAGGGCETGFWNECEAVDV